MQGSPTNYFSMTCLPIAPLPQGGLSLKRSLVPNIHITTPPSGSTVSRRKAEGLGRSTAGHMRQCGCILWGPSLVLAILEEQTLEHWGGTPAFKTSSAKNNICRPHMLLLFFYEMADPLINHDAGKTYVPSHWAGNDCSFALQASCFWTSKN